MMWQVNQQPYMSCVFSCLPREGPPLNYMLQRPCVQINHFKHNFVIKIYVSLTYSCKSHSSLPRIFLQKHYINEHIPGIPLDKHAPPCCPLGGADFSCSLCWLVASVCTSKGSQGCVFLFHMQLWRVILGRCKFAGNLKVNCFNTEEGLL